jgi:hypothetical protein
VTGLCCRIARFALLSISFGGLFPFPATCQTTLPESTANQDKSIATVAREGKANKARAAKVFNDDDMEVHKSPLPVLNLEGDDNTDLILQAIAKYKESHKPEQTEQVIHDWYDEYDAMLAANAWEPASTGRCAKPILTTGTTFANRAVTTNIVSSGASRSCAASAWMPPRSGRTWSASAASNKV